MPFLDAIRLALKQIWVQKLKSFFTLLGVMIGVTFLIAVVSIVGGMSRYMTDQVVGKIMAVNSFELRHRPNINLGEMSEERWRELRRRPRIRETDVEPVAEALPADVKWAVVGNDNLSAQSRYVAKPRQVLTFTVSNDYFDIKKMAPVNGRLFSPQEFERGMPVIVIGQDVANYYFPALDPVGRELVVRGLPFTVVGVMEKQGSAFGISFDHYGSTNSPANYEVCAGIWAALRKAGLVVERAVERLFDPVQKMFLADRFVVGECPRCGTKDQYALLWGARMLHDRLDRLGVAHVYEEFDDDHSDVDYRMERSLPALVASLA
jgi:hypothetical protein